MSENNFRNFATQDSSVQITADRITYTSNRSFCSSLPSIANVILLGPSEATAGSITAVSNTCLEPISEEVTKFKEKDVLKSFSTNQGDLVRQIMTILDPRERNETLQYASSHDDLGRGYAQELNTLVSSTTVSISLFASSAFTTTGMNLLSNRLVRLGIGSDQGSVEGVS